MRDIKTQKVTKSLRSSQAARPVRSGRASQPLHRQLYRKLYRQQGAVLVIGLLILLGMTQLAVTGMTTSITQETIARNTHEIVQTLNATESMANYAFAQTNWINLALSYIDEPGFEDWPTYLFQEADVVGQDVVDRYDMDIEIRAQQSLAPGMSVGDNAHTKVIQLSIEARAQTKDSASGAGNKTTHGWQLLSAG